MNQLSHFEPITYIMKINRYGSLQLKYDYLIGIGQYNQGQRPQVKLLLTIIEGNGYPINISPQLLYPEIYLACDAGYPACTSKGKQKQIFAKFTYDPTKTKYSLSWSGGIITGVDGGLINFKLVVIKQNLINENNNNYEEVFEDIEYENNKYYNFTFSMQQQLLE